MTTEIEKHWLHVIEIHQYTKEFFILAEQHQINYKTFLEVHQEPRHVLEHIIRAKSAELGLKPLLKKSSLNEYEKINMSKALGHAYRGFFDAADFFSMSISSNIDSLIKPYNHDCILHVFPEYYQTIQEDIFNLRTDIGYIRARKDVEIGDDILAEVKEYYGKCMALMTHYRTVLKHLGELSRYKRNEINKMIISCIITFILGIIATVVTTNIFK